VALVSTATTTIRVDRRVHQVLTERAGQRGLTVAALVAELAERDRRAGMIASELEARAADADNPEARAELELWDQALGDGID
jgi:predicted DNA-binding ribbon-helix-helix protein